MQQSDTITKKYLIIERCEKPILSHMGGTFAGTYGNHGALRFLLIYNDAILFMKLLVF